MAEGDFPYFRFYPRDFAASGKVEAMTTEAVGAYILLLGKAWHERPPCSIPNDQSTLARWARLSEDDWTRVMGRVLTCWTLRNDGRLYNARLESEWVKAREETSAKSEGGKRGAKKRWDSHRSAIGNPMASSCQPDPNPQPNPVRTIPPTCVLRSDDLLEAAVARLNVSDSVGRSVRRLVGVTIEEIEAVVAEVQTDPRVRDVGITAASELLRRRGLSIPRRKGGNLTAGLTEATAGVGGLADIVRRRTGRNAS